MHVCIMPVLNAVKSIWAWVMFVLNTVNAMFEWIMNVLNTVMYKWSQFIKLCKWHSAQNTVSGYHVKLVKTLIMGAQIST